MCILIHSLRMNIAEAERITFIYSIVYLKKRWVPFSCFPVMFSSLMHLGISKKFCNSEETKKL
jgi:hypothetical protein